MEGGRNAVFAGFRQIGIDYVRPERMFGVTTNSLLKNLWWAKKGIFSFSWVPLNILSASGSILLLLTGCAMLVQIAARVLFPHLAPQGITTLLTAVLFFGSMNLFAIGLVGEYLAKNGAEKRGIFLLSVSSYDPQVDAARVVRANVLCRHKEEAGKFVCLFFHLLRRLGAVHHQMPKLMRQREAHAIRWLIDVQHDQRRQSWGREGDAVYGGTGHIGVDNDDARRLELGRQVLDWS